MTRLSLDSLGAARPTAARPRVDPRELDVGIVHLGAGAFHRAHQAAFTEDACAASASMQWGIAATTQRSAVVREALVPQDCLYGVLERVGDLTSLRVIGVIREVLDGGGDPASVVSRIADPAIRVLTLTVTEKGYRRAADGSLDVTDPMVAADLGGAVARTAVGQLVRGLQGRQRDDSGPITVVSCDNLAANGRVLRRLVREFVDGLPAAEQDPLRRWVDDSVTFPSSMVDRIVPATTAADRADSTRLLGLEDRGVVATEHFRQWVIEDTFASGRPAWERAGAVLTADVAPWEAVKLRMLNATHSLLAYLGALRGDRTIAEALGRPEHATAAVALMTEDVIPTLVAPPGLDLVSYRDEVLTRFANPALRHTTAQVAMDGSQKLPLRVVETIRARLAQGAVPEWALLVVAAWMTYVAIGKDANGHALPVDDPLAGALREALAGAGDDPRRIVESLLAVRGIFGEDLAHHDDVRATLVAHVTRLCAELR